MVANYLNLKYSQKFFTFNFETKLQIKMSIPVQQLVLQVEFSVGLKHKTEMVNALKLKKE